MAGTGHGYEISNIAAVRRTQRGCADFFADVEGFGGEKGWFFTKAFLKFATSNMFVFKLRQENSRAFLEEADEGERNLLSSKLEAGCDVRRFSRDQFDAHGPDIRHAADYARHLGRTDPRALRKARRMPPAEFFERVRRWVPAKAVSSDLPEGALTTVMTTSAGRRWVELQDDVALRHEGARMSHCVGLGDYTPFDQGGSSRIFSLRDEKNRPLVTVEGSAGRTMSIRQIKAFGNNAIAPGARACVCELLDCLGVVSNQEDLHYAQITLVKGKGWTPIEKVWKRLEISGMDAMAEGRIAILVSPSRPDVSLLRVTGPAGWWENGTRDGLSTTIVDQRNWHLEELRAVCRFIDEFGTNNPLSYGPRDQRIVEKDGRHLPFVDAIERRVEGGLEYFVLPDGGAVIYQSSSRTMPLVEIASLKSGGQAKGGDLYAMPCSPERWNATDSRRCLDLMTLLGVKDMRDSLVEADDRYRIHGADRDGNVATLKRRLGIRRSESGKWYSFVMEAKREPARSLDGEWLVGEDLARLITKGAGGRSYEVHFTQEGVTSTAGHLTELAPLAEIAEFLNGRKLKGNVIKYYRTTLPKKAGAEGWVYHLAGKWRVVRSQKDLATIYNRARTAVPDRQVFTLLPADENERLRSCDDLYARSAPLWLVHQIDTGSLGMYPPMGKSLFSDAVDGHWQAVHWMIDNRSALPARLLKKFVRAMGEKLVSLAEGSTTLTGSRHQAEAGLLLRKMGEDLPKTLVEKAVRIAFRPKAFFRFSNEDDLLWLDLLPRLSNSQSGARSRMRVLGQAGMSLYGLGAIETEEAARVAAGCALACASTRDCLFDNRLQDMRERADELEEKELYTVAAILREGAATAEEARDQRVAAAKRDHEEYMARFFPSRVAA